MVVELYGEDAVEYAAQRATSLKEQGDAMDAKAWRLVLPVIQCLLHERRAPVKEWCFADTLEQHTMRPAPTDEVHGQVSRSDWQLMSALGLGRAKTLPQGIMRCGSLLLGIFNSDRRHLAA